MQRTVKVAQGMCPSGRLPSSPPTLKHFLPSQVYILQKTEMEHIQGCPHFPEVVFSGGLFTIASEVKQKYGPELCNDQKFPAV